jgi:hypothetical protein
MRIESDFLTKRNNCQNSSRWLSGLQNLRITGMSEQELSFVTKRNNPCTPEGAP